MSDLLLTATIWARLRSDCVKILVAPPHTLIRAVLPFDWHFQAGVSQTVRESNPNSCLDLHSLCLKLRKECSEKLSWVWVFILVFLRFLCSCAFYFGCQCETVRYEEQKRVQCECCCWIIALSGEHNAAYARYAHRNSSRWSMGQLSHIAAAQSLLLAAKVIRLSIDSDISGCDSPHAAYTQCAVKNRQGKARQARQLGSSAAQSLSLPPLTQWTESKGSRLCVCVACHRASLPSRWCSVSWSR